MRSIPQVYLQEYCALLLLSMIQVRVTIAALSKHGGEGRVSGEVPTIMFKGLLIPGFWSGRYRPKISMEAQLTALASYLAARFHTSAVTVQAAA